MKIFARTIRTIAIYIFTLLLAVSAPLSVMAETAVTPPPTAPTSQPETTYTYNGATGHWDTNKWRYDAATGTYQAIPQPTPPVVQPIVTAPPVAPTVVVDPPVTTTTPLVAPTIITPQPDNSAIVDNQKITTELDSTNQINAANTVDAQSLTGNATVVLNTTAGNATTGDSTSAATILNNVNSVLSTTDNQKAASFTADVMGDVNGDIILQPMLLKAMLESGPAVNPTTTVATVKNDTTLTNDINLNATTGNAGVIGNTTAGNAQSGAANTVANVVNIINSMVAANQSFIGTVNIYGNLNGDILIAPDFIPQLIASNGTAAGSKNSPTVSVINSKDMQSVINNVSLAAASGKAAVMDNTKAGSATTGDANTNIVIFNLSGHEIVASNSLLVFVNVLGKWVGVIVDAPVGATAAAIGNGVTTNQVAAPDLTIISSDNTSQITNNITLASQSGNATVAGNTTAGNAISGDATASANIANMTNSQFGLSGWFGILFINVFGSWMGSFGIDTASGNPITNHTTRSTQRVIEFIPSTQSHKSSNVTYISMDNNNEYAAINLPTQPKMPKVLGSVSSLNKGPGISPINRLSSSGFNVALLAGSTLMIAVSAAGLNRFRLTRKAS